MILKIEYDLLGMKHTSVGIIDTSRRIVEGCRKIPLYRWLPLDWKVKDLHTQYEISCINT